MRQDVLAENDEKMIIENYDMIIPWVTRGQ
jgi:hypothetical protein